jgi:HprK-related kinase A
MRPRPRRQRNIRIVMPLSDWTRAALCEQLQGRGLILHTGPFATRIRTTVPAVADGIFLLYADYRVSQDDAFADFHVSLHQPLGLRRWWHPQVSFYFDGAAPFAPLPAAQALPMLEWGLNWCVSNHAHEFLILHAATIEKGGRAAILPGPPGAGKSTLTAFLIYNGWRLLSDELTLLSLDDGRVTPLARPVSLKNRAIDVISHRLPAARVSARCTDTAKGTIALVGVPPDSVARSAETALPAWVVFPQFRAGSGSQLRPRSKARTLIDIGHNAFNYSVHGKQSFVLLSQLIDSCDCYDFRYSDLDQALTAFDALVPTGATARAASA